jgi:hypothetical protein
MVTLAALGALITSVIGLVQFPTFGDLWMTAFAFSTFVFVCATEAQQ